MEHDQVLGPRGSICMVPFMSMMCMLMNRFQVITVSSRPWGGLVKVLKGLVTGRVAILIHVSAKGPDCIGTVLMLMKLIPE